MRESKRVVPRELVERLARDMVDALPRGLRDKLAHMDKDRMGKRQKENLVATYFLGGLESEVFREALAEAMLEDAMAFAKLQVGLVPKNVVTESDVRVMHTIVVPQMQTTAQWMEAQTVETVEGERVWKDELGMESFTGEVHADQQYQSGS